MSPAKAGAAPKASAAEKRRAAAILERLAKAYPDWGPTLKFRNAFELLVATILSAQATDERVNEVTVQLFERYPTPHHFIRVPQATLERAIKSTGFFRQKAKAVKACSQGLVEKFGGEVPRDIDALTQLHGVGRKTASVVLGGAYGIPAIAVDRHVQRVSQRLGLTKHADPDKIEFDLRARFQEKDWVQATWCLILHGRRTCRPKPECPRCPVNALCPYPNKTK